MYIKHKKSALIGGSNLNNARQPDISNVLSIPCPPFEEDLTCNEDVNVIGRTKRTHLQIL